MSARLDTDTKDFRLMEAVADIAYQAGVAKYYSGNSRTDIHNFISWAHEFETHRRVDADGNESYFGKDYMTAIEEFAVAKLNAP